MEEDLIKYLTTVVRNRGHVMGLAPDQVEDLQQECLLAAVAALPRFDQDKMQLRTFMHEVVVFRCTDWLNQRQFSVAPLTEWEGRMMADIRRARQTLAQELGREPRNREVAGRLGMTLDRFEQYRTELEYEQVSLEDLTQGEGDQMLGDEVLTHEDLIAGTGVIPGPEFVVELNEIQTILAKEIGNLTEREAQVIDLLFLQEKTLRATGDALDVSYETVRRVKDRALNKLRARLPEEFAEVGSISLEGRENA